MTISSSVSKATLNGDGVQTEFPFAFKVWKAGDLEVSITSPAGANTVVTDWTVELAGSGGTVTYPTVGDPLPLGWMITIRRLMDFLQDVDLVSGTRFDPEVIETALDIAAAERQQLLEEVSRAVRVGVASGEDPANVINQVFEAREAAQDSVGDAAAQVVLCQDQVQLAVNQVLLAEGWADAAALSAVASSDFADASEQSALDAVAAVNSATFNNMPVGTFFWHTGTTPPPGGIVLDGELRSRTAFPDLWAFAQTSGNISVDDASWTFGQYSPGDGSTTFRVPKVDDRFIRGKSDTRAVGLVEEDAFQGHEHNLSINQSRIVTPDINNGTGSGTGPASWGSVIITAEGPITDGINGTPRTADETRPKALTMLPCIKAYDVISDPNVLNAVEVVNEISRLESEKLRKDENINLGVSVAASGTAVDFVGIPEGVKRITVMFDGVSTNGANPLQLQIGSGAVELMGYASAGIYAGATNAVSGLRSTTGLLTVAGIGGPVIVHGVSSLDLAGGNTWAMRSCHGRRDSAYVHIGGGSKSLSGPLDRLRITTVNGTDQFDAGTINIAWEF